MIFSDYYNNYIDEEPPGIKIFYCSEKYTEIRQRHLLFEQEFCYNLFFFEEESYYVTAIKILLVRKSVSIYLNKGLLELLFKIL